MVRDFTSKHKVLLLFATLINVLTPATATEAPMNFIPDCHTSRHLTLNHFHNSTGVGYPKYDTTVELCFVPLPLSLVLHYSMSDDNVSSVYTECNQPLYNGSAVEFFIASGVDHYPFATKYLEVEMNPNEYALYVSLITNTCDDCNASCMTHAMQECDDPSQIPSHTSSVTHSGNHWTADIQISLDWIASLTNHNQDAQQFQANFFRIDHLPSVTQYSCWRPTGGPQPCFHRPSSFGNFSLEQ